MATEKLIQECLAGKRRSQNELYQMFSAKMFAVCLRYAGSRMEAEDILQEGFIKAFTCLHQFNHRGSFEGWLRTIMVNCALRKCQQKPFVVSLKTQAINDDMPEVACAETIARIQEKELLQLIRQLPPVYRTVFNLYVFEGLKDREIAVALGISEGTSKSNLHDARNLLKKNLRQESESGHPPFRKAV